MRQVSLFQISFRQQENLLSYWLFLGDKWLPTTNLLLPGWSCPEHLARVRVVPHEPSTVPVRSPFSSWPHAHTYVYIIDRRFSLGTLDCRKAMLYVDYVHAAHWGVGAAAGAKKRSASCCCSARHFLSIKGICRPTRQKRKHTSELSISINIDVNTHG